MVLGLPNEDMEMLYMAQDVINKVLPSSLDSCEPVELSGCGYTCYAGCEGTCGGSCSGSCTGGSN